MSTYFMHMWGGPFAFEPWGGIVPALVIILAAWSLVWKGLALWHSARNTQGWWFLALLIVNTAGLLEILYLFAFRTDRGIAPLIPGRAVAPKPEKKQPVDSSSPAA